MWRLLTKLQANLALSIPVAMILGVIFGYIGEPSFLRGAIIPFTFLMVYPMMVTLNIREIFTRGDAKLQLVTQVINFGLIPFLGLAIGKIFFPTNDLLVLGLLLTALLPTSGMTISWTGFAGGNISAAVKMTVIGLIVGSLLTPLYLSVLMGAVVEIPILSVFSQIIFIVFLPMVAGYGTQRYLIGKFGSQRYQKEIKGRFPLLSTLGVLAIVFIAMALKAKDIIANPQVLFYLLLPLGLLYGLNFFLSTLIGKYFFSGKDGIALVYGTVMRNLSIALAISMTVFGEQGSEIALIIAMAYIIQVQAAAWYVRFTNRIFNIT